MAELDKVYINDLDALQLPSQLLGKSFEVEGQQLDGSTESYRLGAGLLLQFIAAYLAGPNNRRDLRKAVLFETPTQPGYQPGASALSTLDQEFLCVSSTCSVLRAADNSGAQLLELRADPTGPLLVYADATFTGQRIAARWQRVEPPRYQPVEVIRYADLLFKADDQDYIAPQRTYAITQRPEGGATVYAQFDTTESRVCEYARVEGQAGLFRYSLTTNQLTPVSGAGTGTGGGTGDATLQQRLQAIELLIPSAAQPQDNPLVTRQQLLQAGNNTVLHLPAAADISAGRLVAYLAAGAVPYDAANVAHIDALIGVAAASARSGESVPVQTRGLLQLPGWNLTPGTSYLAGAAGALVTSVAGLAFAQVVGRARTADELLISFQPSVIL